MLGSANQQTTRDVVRQETPAESALGQLAGTVNTLQDRLEALESRIGPVLNPPVPVNAAKVDACGSPIPIVDQIMQQTTRLQRLVDQCNDMIDRVGV